MRMCVTTGQLNDGRRLAFRDWGVPEGYPVLFFHGTPGSRLQRPDDRVTTEAGVRLITIDRPGYGASDVNPNRTLIDWADDVSELVDGLGIDTFAIVGYSGGAPHALACGARLEQRVTTISIVSGCGPYEEVGALDELTPEDRRLRDDYPTRGRVAVKEFAESDYAFRVMNAPSFLDHGSVAPEDRAIHQDPQIRPMLLAALVEATRDGAYGLAWDSLVVDTSWGFELQSVHAAVSVWHGSEDKAVGLRHAEFLIDELPSASREPIWSGCGHSAIFRAERWREVLEGLHRYVRIAS